MNSVSSPSFRAVAANTDRCLNTPPAVVEQQTSTNMTKAKSRKRTNTLQKNWQAVLNNDILTFARPATFDREDVVADPEAFTKFNERFLAQIDDNWLKA